MDAEQASDSSVETGEVDATQMWEDHLDSEGVTEDKTTTEAETTETVDTDEIQDDVFEDEAGFEDEDEDEETESQDVEEQDNALFTVKINGEEKQVTQDELLKGYSQNSSYTQKSQALAEERRGLQEEVEQSRAYRDQAIQVLEAQQAQSQLPSHDEAYWENLKETDPVQWMMERDALREAQVQTQLNQQQLVQMQQQRRQEQDVNMERYVEEQRVKLADLLPEWSDPAKANADKALIVDYGRKAGFTDDELNNAYDVRAVVTMRKAALYDQLQEKRKGLKQKTHTSMKPGVTSGEPRGLKAGKDSKRLKQSGSVDDLARVFENYL